MAPKPSKLKVPAALVVVALGATACTTTSPPPPTDAGTDSPAVADARDFDANCVPPEVYDPVANACIPLV